MTVSKEVVVKTTMPEVPSGDEAVRLCTDLAKAALLDTFPSLILGSHRFLTPSDIRFVTGDEIRAQARQDKDGGNILLAQALRLAGTPEEVIDDNVYNANESSNFYLDPTMDNPMLLVSTRVKDKLYTGDARERTSVINFLGELIISEDLAVNVKKRDLDYGRWEIIAKNYLTTFLKGWKEKYGEILDTERFEKAKSLIYSLLDSDKDDTSEAIEEEDSDPELSSPSPQLQVIFQEIDQVFGPVRTYIRFIAHGAKVYALTQDQQLPTFEFAFGEDFNVGILAYLSDKAIESYRKKLRAKLVPIDLPQYMPEKSKVLTLAKRMVDELGQGKPLSDEQIINEYLNSTFPDLYNIAPRDPRDMKKRLITPHDPWVYPA